MISLVFFVFFVLGVVLGLRGCYLTDMISPVVLLLIAIILNRSNSFDETLIGKGIKFIGSHSLEIYIGNVIACNILGLFNLNQYAILIMYIVLNIAVSYIMIMINRRIVRILN